MIGKEKPAAYGLGDAVVADLCRVGLASMEPGADGTSILKLDAALQLFFPLLRSFDIKLVPMRTNGGCPISFCTGLLAYDRMPAGEDLSPSRTVPGGGQGVAPRDAALSCLGELAERISLYTLGAADARVRVTASQQSEVGLGPILGFSESQEKAIAKGLSGNVQVGRGGEVEWNRYSDLRVQVNRLGTQDTGMLPSYGVFFNAGGLSVHGMPGVASSTGCAVWKDLGGARARALLELAERDSVAQMWYNRLGITRLEKEFLAELLSEPLFAFLSGAARGWAVYHVSTDLPVHVVLAVSHDEGGFGTAFGSAAGWTVASACQSALEELLQMENSLGLMARAYRDNGGRGRPGGRLPRQLQYASQRSVFKDLPLAGARPASEKDLQRDYAYETLVQHCLDKRFDIWEFNATRPDLNIPCVKLLSPDLCGWEPRFGKTRLFSGVVERGLRSTQGTEQEFAARPFPF